MKSVHYFQNILPGYLKKNHLSKFFFHYDWGNSKKFLLNKHLILLILEDPFSRFLFGFHSPIVDITIIRHLCNLLLYSRCFCTNRLKRCFELKLIVFVTWRSCFIIDIFGTKIDLGRPSRKSTWSKHWPLLNSLVRTSFLHYCKMVLFPMKD